MNAKQLQNEAYRFLLVKAREKKPLANEWQKEKNLYAFNNQNLLQHIENGGNYGVCCGYGNLAVIDADTERISAIARERLSETFEVKTGGGGTHFYFETEVPMKTKAFDEGTGLTRKNVGHIRGAGAMVVGPGSIHPNGTPYVVLKDIPITKATCEQLISAFSEFYEGDIDTTDRQYSDDKKYYFPIGKLSVLNRLKKTNSGRWQGAHPIHGSSTGSNFTVDESKNVWYCFRHNCGGNALTLLALQEDLIQCGEKLRGDAFKKTITKAQELGYIPKDEHYLSEPAKKQLQVGVTQFTDAAALAVNFIEKCPTYFDGSGQWWLWEPDSFKWKMCDETQILIKIEDAYERSSFTTAPKNKQEILEVVRRAARRNTPEKALPTWVQFKDTIYDVITGEHFPASSKFFIVNPIPWKMGETEDTPTIDNLLREWVVKEKTQDETWIKTLEEIAAYTMLSFQPLQKMFATVGIGRNGKTKYQELVGKFVGSENVGVSELKLLTTGRFEYSALYQKLAVFLSELEESELKDSTLLKKMCGEDLIRYEFKGKTPYNERSYATCLMATNALPVSNDKSEGYFRRWVIVDFPNQFEVGRDVIGEIPEYEFENWARKLLRIARELLNRKTFTNQGTIKQTTERYEERSNPVAAFIKDHYNEEPNAHVVFRDFYSELSTWLPLNNHRQLSVKMASELLKDCGFVTAVNRIKTSSETSDTVQKVVIFGLTPKPENYASIKKW